VARVFEGKLSDLLAIQYLIDAYPPEVVEHAVAITGRAGTRTRMLPPPLVVYLVLAMCLFPDAGYEQVCQLLGQCPALPDRWQVGPPATAPSTAAVSRARVRLGSPPLRELLAWAIAGRGRAWCPGTGYRRWRLRTMDGYVAAVPYSQAAVTVRPPGRGAPGSRPGRAGIRISVLADDETSQLIAADVSADNSPAEVPVELAGALGRGDLLLAAGDYARPGLWRRAAATGADLLCSVPAAVPPATGELLADGSRLCVPRGGGWVSPGTPVRVLGGVSPGPRALVTTILDPAAAPAAELTAVHRRRRRFRQAEVFREQADLPIRSRSREMAEQEIWGHLLVHAALRRPAAAAAPGAAGRWALSLLFKVPACGSSSSVPRA